jgi:hypothetical protein
MTVALGSAPESMRLVLTSGADFICTIVSNDGDWPSGAVIAIETEYTVWTATIVGPEARFNVDKDEVDALIAQKPRRFRLAYAEGTADLVWGSGLVSCVA